jgi:hypothetical protein
MTDIQDLTRIRTSNIRPTPIVEVI